RDDRVICDMHEPGLRRVLIPGGRGGWGNAHFATSTRQAPNFANPGQKREIQEIKLTLKSIADVGLVGYPNVGKSSLLATVTAAKPKIANYHFTTLSPNLGICRRYGVDFVMADIPGLIEGASEGAGLGFRFLQHVERTRMLLHVVDVSGCEGRDPVADFEQIMDELAAYGGLAERPMIVAANKMDLPEAEKNLEKLRAHLKGTDIQVIPISAATGEGVDDLMNAVVQMLPELPETTVFEEEPEALMEEEEPFVVAKEGSVYVVTGPLTERMISSTNFENTESMGWFHRTLRARGVIDALRAAGAKEGDTVVFGDMEFDFVE
ncbi:MAG: Obg family GTPase CgtA, partial [Clostridia bacterium]|nr:Obg family GTPase CgtA [Clostridia bacterium]